MPGAAEIDVGGGGRSVYVVSVVRRVVLVGQFVEVWQEDLRNVGPSLRTSQGIEGMQHAVIRANIDHSRSRADSRRGVAGLVRAVASVGIVE